MNRIANVVRVATIPPVLALVLSTVLYIYNLSMIGGVTQYCAMVFFLSVMPALAYPLQPLIPPFKHMGRDGQRNLAFVASVTGYFCGVLFALITAAPIAAHIIYWTYFVSVALLTVFNRVTKWKASGHACGVAGPVVSMLYFIGPRVLPAILIFALMAWASLKMKRHTPAELLLGGVDSITSFLLVLLASRIFV